MANPNPNTSGLRPPWKAGESGNPNGRPKRPSMNSVLDSYVQDEDPGALREMIKTGIEKAKAGDFRFWQAIYDRFDGKPTNAIEVIDDDGPDYADDPEPQIT